MALAQDAPKKEEGTRRQHKTANTVYACAAMAYAASMCWRGAHFLAGLLGGGGGAWVSWHPAGRGHAGRKSKSEALVRAPRRLICMSPMCERRHAINASAAGIGTRIPRKVLCYDAATGRPYPDRKTWTSSYVGAALLNLHAKPWHQAGASCERPPQRRPTPMNAQVCHQHRCPYLLHNDCEEEARARIRPPWRLASAHGLRDALRRLGTLRNRRSRSPCSVHPPRPNMSKLREQLATNQRQNRARIPQSSCTRAAWAALTPPASGQPA